ncbi:MAG: hypothetical protein IJO63_01170 [Bacilli bacterium]|nr:hypothetical protein [Bacilli bacterium]
MKIKYLIMLFCMLLVCGCQDVKNKDIGAVISLLEKGTNKNNTYRTGYKYYLPTGMSVKEYSLYNDVLNSSVGTFYLYVDLISYYSKVENSYEVSNAAYHSEVIKYDEKYGYLEINSQENNQYLIEIMFNYAKIEVMVDYDNINYALSQAVSILRSMEYNDNVIANLLGDDVLSYQEEVYNIFNTTSKDSIYLQSVAEDSAAIEDNKDFNDTDLIN